MTSGKKIVIASVMAAVVGAGLATGATIVVTGRGSSARCVDAQRAENDQAKVIADTEAWLQSRIDEGLVTVDGVKPGDHLILAGSPRAGSATGTGNDVQEFVHHQQLGLAYFRVSWHIKVNDPQCFKPGDVAMAQTLLAKFSQDSS